MNKQLRIVSILFFEAQPGWLALSREKRNEIMGPLRGILTKHSGVSLRWLDADTIGHGYTDMALCEYHDIRDYHFLWEELRDTPVFSVPYFILKSTSMGIEDAYVAYEKEASS